jgi:uncharacterized membrane protein SpoIIM required for sporulation
MLGYLINELKKPVYVFFYSAFISIVSIYISVKVFEKYESFFITFLITLSLIPFFKKIVNKEVKNTLKVSDRNFFERYLNTIYFYLLVLFGLVFGMSLVYIFLPSNISEKIFEKQIEAIKKIRGMFIGNLFNNIPLLGIFFHNLSVLFLCFILSLLYGLGSLLIISWNATVLATAIGMLTKNYGIFFYPQAFLTFLPHGMLEFISFFLAGLGGAILSVASARRKIFEIKKFYRDSFKLLLYSILILFVAAIIETLILTIRI